MSEYKYKYAHLLTVDSPLYNKAIQKLIFENQNCAEHIFIYLGEKSFSVVEKLNYGKTVLEKSSCTVELIRKALEIAEIVLIHNNGFSNSEIAKLTDAEAGRIVWSVWGPDLYKNDSLKKRRSLFYKSARFIYHLIRYKHIETFKNFQNQIALAESKINKFHAITAGFEGDIAEIKKRFPNVPVLQALYPAESSLDNIILWQEKVLSDNNQHKVRILLGHCAFSHLKHKKWLKNLYPVRDKVELYIPLNYGNKKYADKIEKLAKKLYGNAAIVYRETMTPEKYFVQILAKVDFAIFDFEIQSAYGNALMLLYQGKKVYYPQNSAMYIGLSNAGVAVSKIEDLDIKNIDNLPCLDYKEIQKNIDFATKRMNLKTHAEQWNSVFAFLENSK